MLRYLSIQDTLGIYTSSKEYNIIYHDGYSYEDLTERLLVFPIHVWVIMTQGGTICFVLEMDLYNHIKQNPGPFLVPQIKEITHLTIIRHSQYFSFQKTHQDCNCMQVTPFCFLPSSTQYRALKQHGYLRVCVLSDFFLFILFTTCSLSNHQLPQMFVSQFC